MFARVPVAHELLGARVEVLLADPNAFAERGRGRLVQDSDAGARTAGDLDAIEPGAGFGDARAHGPHLARRQRIAFDRLVAVQLRRRHELLDALGPEDVAEVRIAELAFEAALLLFLYAPPGFKRHAYDPFRDPRRRQVARGRERAAL